MSRPVIGVLAAALLGAAAAARAQNTAPEPSSPPVHEGRPVRSPGNAVWAPDLATAHQRAAADGAFVYHEFTRKACGGCGRMQGLLYPAFDFEALLIGMVPVVVDLDSPDGQRLAERYHVEEAPSVLITTASGRLVFLMQGFQDAPDFYAHVHSDLDAYRRFAKTVDAQDVSHLPAAEAYRTGQQLYARFDFEGAAVRLARAADAKDTTPAIQASALEGLAAADLELGKTAESRRAIDRLIATTKDAKQKENAELFRAQISLVENKPQDALAAYKRFAKDHPDSPYLDKVKTFIARLEAGTHRS
jgi:tetratricopeptide (TPR) repeat protein